MYILFHRFGSMVVVRLKLEARIDEKFSNYTKLILMKQLINLISFFHRSVSVTSGSLVHSVILKISDFPIQSCSKLNLLYEENNTKYRLLGTGQKFSSYVRLGCWSFALSVKGKFFRYKFLGNFRTSKVSTDKAWIQFTDMITCNCNDKR